MIDVLGSILFEFMLKEKVLYIVDYDENCFIKVVELKENKVILLKKDSKWLFYIG